MPRSLFPLDFPFETMRHDATAVYFGFVLKVQVFVTNSNLWINIILVLFDVVLTACYLLLNILVRRVAIVTNIWSWGISKRTVVLDYTVHSYFMRRILKNISVCHLIYTRILHSFFLTLNWSLLYSRNLKLESIF